MTANVSRPGAALDAPDATSRATRHASSGLGDLALVGAGAGLCAGASFGLVDGLVALRDGPTMGAVAALGCLAAAVLVYAGGFGGAGLALALGGGPLLRRRERSSAFALVLGLLLAAGLFLELFWWTRPFVFYGVKSTDPRRLAAAAGMAVLALAAGLALGRAALRLSAGFYRVVVGVLVLAAVGGGLTLFGAWRAEHSSTRGALNERNRDLPNVLLFVVDALRADVLEPYGHPRVKTPNAQALADRGVVFDNAFVQAPYTWTSFGSLLTGKYPRRHGLVRMDPRMRMKVGQNVTLPLHLKRATLADGDELRDGDFAGATFMTGMLSNSSGLMYGFDWYFEAMAGHELVSLDSRWSVFRSELLLFKIKNKLTQRFDNSLVTTTAVDWLRANAGKRFVGMVHLYSTHTPYDPEPQFREQYCDPAYDGPIHAFYAEHRIAIEDERYAPTPADVAQIRNLYLGGVAQADRDVGLVLDELRRLGELDDTVVILTSDHGEELHEHGLWEHNWMYQTNLRIPLIVSWPNGFSGGVRERAIVESIDVFPTVCDLLDLELPPNVDEYQQLDGKSLLPLLRGETDTVKEFSFAENGTHVSIQDTEWKLIVPAGALSDDDDESWTKAKAAAINPVRLFHLTDDPEEHANLLASEPEQAERLFAALKAWDRTMPIARYEIDLSARDIDNQALAEKLGYAGEGVGADVDFDPGGAKDEESGSPGGGDADHR